MTTCNGNLKMMDGREMPCRDASVCNRQTCFIGFGPVNPEAKVSPWWIRMRPPTCPCKDVATEEYDPVTKEWL